MADTFTAHYNLTKPQIGGDPDTWGTLLNANFDAIDTQMSANNTLANAALPKAGGTLTGPLAINQTASQFALTIGSAGVNGAGFKLIGDGTTTPSKYIRARAGLLEFVNDANNAIVTTMTDAGAWSFAQRPTFNGATPWDSANFTPSNYLPLAGGTMTGSLTLSSNPLLLNAPSAAERYFYIQTNGATRWRFGGTSDAETGGNAGTNWVLTSFNDAGAYLNTPVSVNRATGVATFSARPVFGAATPWDSANFTPGNYALLSGAAFTGAVSVGAVLSVNTSGQAASVAVTDSGANGAGIKLSGNGATTPSKYIRARAGLLEFVNDANNAIVTTMTDTGHWSAADFSASSDIRKKTEIRSLLRGLDELKRMPPREYLKEGREEIGFIAQEAQVVIPEAVSVDPEGFLTLSYGQTLALVASAVLDLDAPALAARKRVGPILGEVGNAQLFEQLRQ